VDRSQELRSQYSRERVILDQVELGHNVFGKAAEDLPVFTGKAESAQSFLVELIVDLQNSDHFLFMHDRDTEKTVQGSPSTGT
jgi:hypothetical protein